MTPHRLDPTLLAIARAQGGMFLTAQATTTGISKFELVRLVKADVILHPGRGLYAVSALVERDPEAWHRHLMHGATLLYDDVTFTGVSALVAHEIRLWGADLTRPELLRPVRRGTTLECFHLRPGIVNDSVDTSLGPTVDLARALVQYAMDVGIEPAVASMDHALHEDKVDPEALETAVRNVAFWPHSSRAAAAVSLADGRRESVAESRCGVALALAGIEATPQVEIRNRKGRLLGRADFLVANTNIIIEVDGKVKYASGDPEVLWAEKKREDALRRAGYIVVRITWADLERPGAVAAAVRRALVAA